MSLLAIRSAQALAHKSPRKPRPLPRIAWPKAIAGDYYGELRDYVTRIRSAFGPLISSLPVLFERRDSARLDSPDRIAGAIAQAQAELARTITPEEIKGLASAFARRTQEFSRAQMNRQTRAALGVDLFVGSLDPSFATAMQRFAVANVELVKGLAQETQSRLAKVTTQAMQAGTLHKDLAKQLKEQFGFAESRAALIARDQIGKLYGQVNATRQKSIGVKRFIWRTANDARVRPEHEDRDGEEFEYANPPEDGLPGEAINCRCYAEPIFSDILDSL